MSDAKYLILERHKYNYSVRDVWTVKFSDLTQR